MITTSTLSSLDSRSIAFWPAVDIAMMMLINYDLKRVKDYPRLYGCLQIWGAQELLESCWIADAVGPPSAVRDVLRVFVDGDDALFIVEIADGAHWATLNVSGRGFEMLKAQSILQAA